MAKISFTTNEYQSGKATIHSVKVEGNKLSIGFDMENGKKVRENYFINKVDDLKKLKEAVKAILGHVPEDFDTDSLVGLPCYVELEERPWTEGRTWMGVGAVLPIHKKKPKTGLPEFEKRSAEDLFDKVC